jgi:hypothetical protein
MYLSISECGETLKLFVASGKVSLLASQRLQIEIR